MSDTTVRCEKCGRTKRVDFSVCLRMGWPKCHGYTMRLDKYPIPADIERATKKAIEAQIPKEYLA